MKNFTSANSLYLYFLFCSFNLAAQQVPLLNYYQFDATVINPASLGDGYLGGIYRQQFSDLPAEVAPTTYQIQADISPLLGKLQDRIGLGVNLIGDEVHIFNRHTFSGNFAYHLIPEGAHRVSLGVTAGFQQERIEFDDASLNDPNDLAAFEGRQTKMVFNGGLGLSYQYLIDNGSALEFDLILPQLFTPDISHEKGAITNLLPHVLANIGYRIKLRRFSVVPIVSYRELLGNDGLKAGNYAFLVKAYFLQDKLWAGAAYRPNANSYAFNIGVQPVEKVKLFAGLESHPALGRTSEFGAFYKLSKSAKGSKTFEQEELLLQHYSVRANRSNEKIQNIIRQDFPTSRFESIRAIMDQIHEGKISDEKTGETLADARKQLDQAQLDIATIKKERAKIEAFRFSADSLLQQLALQYVEVNNQKKYVQRISKAYEQSGTVIKAPIQEYDQLAADFKLMEKQYQELPPIQYYFNQPEIVQQHYQQSLDELLIQPPNMAPVQVEKRSSQLWLQYAFPNSLLEYDLSTPEMNDVRLFMEYIAGQISNIQEETIQKVSKVQLTVQLRFDEAILSTLQGGSYNGELGPNLLVNYRFEDNKQENPLKDNRTLNIQAKDIDLKELAVLKLHAMKQHLNAKGVEVPIELIVQTPVQQTVAQNYQIHLIVKKY